MKGEMALKEKFDKPQLEITVLEAEDIILTSDPDQLPIIYDD